MLHHGNILLRQSLESNITLLDLVIGPDDSCVSTYTHVLEQIKVSDDVFLVDVAN